MFVYIGIYLFLILVAMIEILAQNKKISFITFGTLSLFAGLRFYTGFDYPSYQFLYSEVNSLSDVFSGAIGAEPGYLFLTYLFQGLGLNYPTFLLFFAILSIGLLFVYVYRNFEYPSLILLYYFARFYMARDMGQIRGSIASIILLYSLPYLQKEDFKKFMTVVLAASLFHISSFVFLLAYLFKVLHVKITPKRSVILLGISSLIGAVASLPQLYAWIIPARYVSYFTSPSYTNGQWLLNPVLWMQLMIFFGTLLLTKLDKDDTMRLRVDLYFVSSLILISGGRLGTIGGRLSSPFTTQEVFIVPHLILNLTRNKLLNVLLYLGFTTVIFILIFYISGNYTDYIPYQTIFH